MAMESIALGIADRDRSTGANLLPNVNPTFNWAAGAAHSGAREDRPGARGRARLAAGQTATVSVNPPETAREGAPSHS